MVGPISPDAVKDKQFFNIPDEMYEAINQLITENWDNGEASFKKEQLEIRYLQKLRLDETQTGRSQLRYAYEKGFFNFVDVYRQAGWNVTLDIEFFNYTFKKNYEKI